MIFQLNLSKGEKKKEVTMGDETGFAGRELSDEFGKTNDLKDTRLWPRPSLIW